MFNCYKVTLSSVLIAIIEAECEAEFFVNNHPMKEVRQSAKIEGAYIPNIGF